VVKDTVTKLPAFTVLVH